ADGAEPARTALFLTPPESSRGHPCYEHVAPRDLLQQIIETAGLKLHPRSRALDGGAAAGLASLRHAGDLLAGGEVRHVLIAGVDSLVNPHDIGRLLAANRLMNDDNPKGFVPGEGAAAVCLTQRAGKAGRGCTILATGSATETDTAATDRFSQGRAMLAALKEAAGGGEPEVDFVLSNVNGERYAFWEATLAHARFYRTRRERLPTVYPAMTVGDIGAAGAALSLVIARDAFETGYAPGKIAMAEIASESGLRSAAILRGESGG
ncbi:MAG: hypothetical protein HC844_17075, partial [Tabrizicola sp.]|nr:hypothetical protein [Tabrizicola sp.]